MGKKSDYSVFFCLNSHFPMDRWKFVTTGNELIGNEDTIGLTSPMEIQVVTCPKPGLWEGGSILAQQGNTSPRVLFWQARGALCFHPPCPFGWNSYGLPLDSALQVGWVSKILHWVVLNGHRTSLQCYCGWLPFPQTHSFFRHFNIFRQVLHSSLGIHSTYSRRICMSQF